MGLWRRRIAAACEHGKEYAAEDESFHFMDTSPFLRCPIDGQISVYNPPNNEKNSLARELNRHVEASTFQLKLRLFLNAGSTYLRLYFFLKRSTRPPASANF